jgi:hypothetical protein
MTGDQIAAIVTGALPTVAIFGVTFKGGRWAGRIETKVDNHGIQLDELTKGVDNLKKTVDRLPCEDCPVPAKRVWRS